MMLAIKVATAGALLGSALFYTAAPALAQFRGGAGAVGVPRPGPAVGVPRAGAAVGVPQFGGVSPGARPLFPRNVPAPRFAAPSLNAYPASGGYIPHVGYYLPAAAQPTRPQMPGLGSFGEESLTEGLPKQPIPPPVAPGQQAAAAARVQVLVSAEAGLWFGGTKVASEGAAREFQTPVLQPGRLYEYEVQARWKENGRERTRTQQVILTAGSDVKVDLTPPSGSAR
jgi:uncharacterized protein (TIGR03000 family)